MCITCVKTFTNTNCLQRLYYSHSTKVTTSKERVTALKIASVQTLIKGPFPPNTDRVENKNVLNTGVFLPVWYVFTGKL